MVRILLLRNLISDCSVLHRFDSNYHYVVPELSEETDFKLVRNKALEEYNEAFSLGIVTRPVILGPISYLVLGKAAKEASAEFQPISLLNKLLPVYEQLLMALKSNGVDTVQVDEPVLVLDKAFDLESQYNFAYTQLAPIAPKIMLTTYFARLDSNINFIAKLPIAGLHIDLCRAPDQLSDVLKAIRSKDMILSLGVVSGRNIWKCDFTKACKQGHQAIEALGSNRVVVATSSSLLHTPVTLASEKQLTADQKEWFSFALEKAAEVATIAAILSGSQESAVSKALENNSSSIAKRREFERTSDDEVRKRVASVTLDMYHRRSEFSIRRKEQAEKLKLPPFPTTTIGSFPVSICCPQIRSFLSFAPANDADPQSPCPTRQKGDYRN